jgi:hypothetical protein
MLVRTKVAQRQKKFWFRNLWGPKIEKTNQSGQKFKKKLARLGENPDSSTKSRPDLTPSCRI